MTSKRKVVFCVPSLEGPTAPFKGALEKSIGAVIGAGWDEGLAEERGCPYISSARATMLRKALDAKADVIVYLDYDLSWRPGDLLKLIETEGDVVSGLYRFKKPEVEYMGVLWPTHDGVPKPREDGAIRADRVPAGFLKITKEAVDRFMAAYPELCFGPRYHPSVDLFNHGAHEGVWWGEDYAFCRRWNAIGGEIWVVPDLDLTHHSKTEAFPGNYHEWLLRQPGGSKAEAT
jgi:glycosyltransferase involved in cell wall biosynthesis